MFSHGMRESELKQSGHVGLFPGIVSVKNQY